ncbi:MAG TPA: DNA polymerase III subunit beta [Spirochaetia bacterium]|nr:DNA polymerase III subunit beta [Spirochaetia bacterium]
MKFTCSRDDILREISIAQEVISSKNSLSVLSNVLLTVSKKELSLHATDLKVGFETSLPVETVQEGTTTAFCDKLQGILRSLPEGDVELEQIDATMLRIRPLSKKIDFQLRCIPSDKYPELARVADSQYFDFPQKDFIDMVSKTLFAVSDDETRYFMNGIFLEKRDDNLIMVATDGRRLAFISRRIPIRMENLKGIILPPKILTIVRKLSSGEGSLSLALTDKNVFIRMGATNLSSNLIDGQFPDYRRVIPDAQRFRAVVERRALEDALRRVSLLVEQKSRKVVFSLAGDVLTILSRESELGIASEEVPCEYEGPEMSLAVNCLYMSEPLRELSCDTVSLEFSDVNKAITLKPQPEDGYLNIIMPMQLD